MPHPEDTAEGEVAPPPAGRRKGKPGGFPFEVTPYAGHYVAIAHERVVASGEDPGAAYEAATAKYPREEVLLWKVMPSGVFVFVVDATHGR